jgi:hypothetical protein
VFALGQHPRAVLELLGHSRLTITINVDPATPSEVLREAADRMCSVSRHRNRIYVRPPHAAAERVGFSFGAVARGR